MAYLGNTPLFGTYEKLDSLQSQFNGVLKSFLCKVDGNQRIIGSPNQLLVVKNGLVLEPIEDYNTTGDNITFVVAPVALDEISIRVFGSVFEFPGVAQGAVTSGKIASQAITTDKLSNGAVTTQKILDENVTTDKLGSLSVTTTKVANGAITTDKLSNGAVTTDKLGADAVTADKIADATITTDKLATSTVNDLVGDIISPIAMGVIRNVGGVVTLPKQLGGYGFTVTRVSAGIYELTSSRPLPSSYYVVCNVSQTEYNSSTRIFGCSEYETFTKTTSKFQIICMLTTSTYIAGLSADPRQIIFSVYAL